MMSKVTFVSICTLLFVIGTLAKPAPEEDAEQAEPGNANVYLDMVLKLMRQKMYEEGMDPYRALNKTILGVHIDGDVVGLGTIHRSGDATLEYKENDAIEVETTLTVYDLGAELKWATRVLLLPVHGTSETIVSEVNVQVKIRMDLQSVRIILSEFHITHVGKIESKLDFIPIPGIDTVLAKINDAIANFVKGAVVKLFENQIKQIAQDAIDKIGIPDFGKH